MRWIASLAMLAALAGGRATADPTSEGVSGNGNASYVNTLVESRRLDDGTLSALLTRGFYPNGLASEGVSDFGRRATGRVNWLRGRPPEPTARDLTGKVFSFHRPGVPTPDLEVPVRRANTGPAVIESPNR